MRVLQIANYRKGVGGISSQVDLLKKNLTREGMECEVFTTNGSLFKRIISPARLFRLGQTYDVFHIHACSNRGFFPAIIGITIGRILNKRVLLTYHGGDAASFFESHPRFIRRFLTKTDANIVLSGYIGQIFDRYSIPYSIIPNILEFDTSYFKSRASISPKFISIRALRPLYNITCILKAFQIVKASLPSASLTIVGDGISREELENYVSDNRIADVTFIGRVDNSTIPSLLNQADIMLSSPRIDNMPISLLEGFNSGLLVISSKVGGIPYMITDGVNGLLFDYDDYHMLAEKMLYACSHQTEAKAIIAKAYESLNNYNWQTIREKYIKLCQG